MIARVNYAHQGRNLRIQRSGLTFFSVALLAFVFALNVYTRTAHATQGWTRPIITQVIDEGKRVALSGNSRPEANAMNDRSLVPDDFRMEHMLLQLRRSPEQEQTLKDLIDQLHNPGSPNFHQWLTAQEFGERFGLAEADLDKITTWLAGHGFQINVVYPSGMVIDFSGFSGRVRQAFRTEIHYLEVSGVRPSVLR